VTENATPEIEPNSDPNSNPARLSSLLDAWLASPPGRYVLSWEAERFDELTADMFGFNAVQLGMPQCDTLRANRMPQRWIALPPEANLAAENENVKYPVVADSNTNSAQEKIALVTAFSELPFDSNSIDLVVLPHTLEFTGDPHACLREVARVLVPEGKVVITGFNNWSMWGMRQRLGTGLRRHTGLFSKTQPFLPSSAEVIAYARCKDWLRLLGFELERGRFGCYRPPCRSEKWLERMAFLEGTGDRWWPVFGAAYCIVAVKRVKATHINGAAWKRQSVRSGKFAPAVSSEMNREIKQ
jgi:SAM-dependent methyltransferase